MVASTSDLFKKVATSTVTTLASPGKALAATSITVGSTTNYPTDTGVVVAIRVVSATGQLVAGTYTEWSATVSSGTTLAIAAVPVYGSDQVYPAGSTTQVFVPVSSYAQNKLIDGLVVQHTQTGTHKNITTDTLVTSGNVTIGGSLTIGGAGSGGYDPITGTVTAVTANGNRSYDLPTSADNTALISPGMRLRTTRTVAAPTQSTSLNGTSQYYSKTTPAGMTFTDDFTVSAWVKLSSYGNFGIASRYNGTSGWILNISAAGQPTLTGLNGGAGNQSNVLAYQSIPLNKWVHVAAQLDMSAFTATTTTSYIMIDGVDVPVSVTRAGTNPTALIQAGNLEIGTQAGANFWNGKIAQVAIYSAKVTQATIKASMNQTLSGTETNLISAYSFNNTINDLNTTNANNLTANGSAVATNADSPFGGQANGTISSTLDYAIVQKVTAGTLTVQVPEGCTIPTSGGVSAVSYSTQKMPFGFPGQKGKFRLETYIGADIACGTVVDVYYSGATTSSGSVAINIPVGSWMAKYDAEHDTARTGTNDYRIQFSTLSTSTSVETDIRFRRRTLVGILIANVEASYTRTAERDIDISVATPYYLLVKEGQPITSQTIKAGSFIQVDNGYL